MCVKSSQAKSTRFGSTRYLYEKCEDKAYLHTLHYFAKLTLNFVLSVNLKRCEDSFMKLGPGDGLG